MTIPHLETNLTKIAVGAKSLSTHPNTKTKAKTCHTDIHGPNVPFYIHTFYAPNMPNICQQAIDTAL